MATMVIRHTVEDFAKWKAFFDEHAKERKASGSQGGMLFRGPGNEVVAIFNWSSMEAARAFTQDPSMKEAMQRSGVNSAPTIYFVEKVEDLPA